MNKEISYSPNSAENFRLFGFATGNYHCTCSQCKKVFIGDKRAQQCLTCAIDYANSLVAVVQLAKELVDCSNETQTCPDCFPGSCCRKHDHSFWLAFGRLSSSFRKDVVCD